MKKFHPALVALTIIGSIVIATATRAETQDTGYQGNAQYARPYHSQYAHPYHSQYAASLPLSVRASLPLSVRGTLTATRTPTIMSILPLRAPLPLSVHGLPVRAPLPLSVRGTL